MTRDEAREWTGHGFYPALNSIYRAFLNSQTLEGACDLISLLICMFDMALVADGLEAK